MFLKSEVYTLYKKVCNRLLQCTEPHIDDQQHQGPFVGNQMELRASLTTVYYNWKNSFFRVLDQLSPRFWWWSNDDDDDEI
jgi:hypothetical protein